jgi:hypothetical protein
MEPGLLDTPDGAVAASNLGSPFSEVRKNSEDTDTQYSTHPLLNGDILESLFEYLDPRSLFSSESLYFDRIRDVDRDYTFLASLCLVSRSWLVPAQRLLYRVIPILEYYPPRLFSFYATISGNSRIRPYVRRLHALLLIKWRETLEMVALLPRCLLFVRGLHWRNSDVAEELPILDSCAHLSLESPISWSDTLWTSGFWLRLESLHLRGDISAPVGAQDQRECLPSLRKLVLSELQTSLAIPFHDSQYIAHAPHRQLLCSAQRLHRSVNRET